MTVYTNTIGMMVVKSLFGAAGAIWEFPKITDPNVDPAVVGALIMTRAPTKWMPVYRNSYIINSKPSAPLIKNSPRWVVDTCLVHECNVRLI